MNVIVFASRKGGSGKSTLAAHLAAHVHKATKPILMVDADRDASNTRAIMLSTYGHDVECVSTVADARSHCRLRHPDLVLVGLNAKVRERIAYVIRDEPGVWTPEDTLGHGRGSCRDTAVLLVALMRARGVAARFVSGYLVQLADEGKIGRAHV